MKRTGIFIFAAALALTGCSIQDGSFENKMFINADNYRSEVRVATDEGVKTLTRNLSVSVAKPLDNDIDVTVVKSPELLDTYRKAWYDEMAELLPDANCSLDGLSTVLRKGDVTSKDIELTFTGLDKLDYSKVYVLPVTIAPNGVEVLERAKTMYYVVKEASLVNAVADIKGNRAWPVWDNWAAVKNLETFTMETLINCHAFNNESKILTVMGVEDHFLVRIGDVTIPSNQIQIACAYKDVEGNSTLRADLSDASLQLKADRWYHLAVTFNRGVIKVYIDGRLRAEKDLSVIGTVVRDGVQVPVEFKSVDFSAPHSDESDGKPRCFWVGYSYDDKRSLDGMIAETRLWNKVLTAEEINAPNHFYKLYPSDIDASLLAYWKFDDAAGKTAKDYSSYGNNLTADHDILWRAVTLP